MLTAILTPLSFILVGATLLPLLNQTHWVVRSMDFPRLQILALLTLVAAANVALILSQSEPNLIAVQLLNVGLLVAASLYQLYWILPYTPFWTKDVKRAEHANDHEISVLSSNVLMTNNRAHELVERVKEFDPDILVTLESNAWWQERLEVLHKDYPHRLACPLQNYFGMHVYSKLPLLDAEIAFLVEKDRPSMHAAVMLGNKRVQLHFMHPSPPGPTENTLSRQRDAELLMLAEKLKDQTATPTIVAGDLNDVAWSKTTRAFLHISQLLDPRIGRGFFNTFHTGYRFFRWPLDHLFHSKHFQLRSIQRLQSIGSDHFPLLARLQLTNDVRATEKASIQDEDEALAQDRMQEEGVSPAKVPTP